MSRENYRQQAVIPAFMSVIFSVIGLALFLLGKLLVRES